MRIPTVNPPGDEYEACARFLGDHLRRRDFDVDGLSPIGRPEHNRPSSLGVNVADAAAVMGRVVQRPGTYRRHRAARADGFLTLDPFGGLVRDGKIFGRRSRHEA